MSEAGIENKFISEAIQKKKFVNIYLVSGLHLTGVIEEHDEKCVYLKKEKHMIIYKQIIASILV